ncbi:MAG TPA: 3-isopropylmalate dehydratase [Firmicutes bacterium]|nr:3-isopropylmalate dehydratase [Bacillota bacterium]
MLRGRVWRLGDGISTDLIAPGRYFHLRSNLPELARHLLEDVNPELAAGIQPGDILVAGRDFGIGSSREHAPRIIKISGVAAVVAESFSRLFFRNAVNIGLPVVVCDTAGIEEGDCLKIDLGHGVLSVPARGIRREIPRLPAVMLDILSEGGLVPYVKKHGDLRTEAD